MSEVLNTSVESEECAECNRLWENFAQASAALVQLIDEKYSTDKRAHALLDLSIRQAISKRQQAKQAILAHERDQHSKGAECSVCGGTGRVRQDRSTAAEYEVCTRCRGSGVTQVP